jgi:hypothetical protein
MRTFASTTALLFTLIAPLVSAQSFYPGVVATGTQGPTNPPQATLGTAINQTSMSRLLSVNSVDVSCTINIKDDVVLIWVSRTFVFLRLPGLLLKTSLTLRYAFICQKKKNDDNKFLDN